MKSLACFKKKKRIKKTNLAVSGEWERGAVIFILGLFDWKQVNGIALMMMDLAGSQSRVGVIGKVLHQVSRTAELDTLEQACPNPAGFSVLPG